MHYTYISSVDDGLALSMLSFPLNSCLMLRHCFKFKMLFKIYFQFSYICKQLIASLIVVLLYLNNMSNYKERKQKLKELVKKQQQERIRKIQQQGHQFKDTDAFKRHQKHYKYYVHRKTDYSKLLSEKDTKHRQINGYQVYQLEFPKGAYLVKQFCTTEQQIQIGMQALNQYIHRPYRTNLDGTNGLYDQKYQYQNEVQIEPIYIHNQQKQSKKQAKIDQIEKEQIVLEKNESQQKTSNQQQKVLYYFNEKIRMSNLGYQYDWPHRSYPSTKVPIPQAISQLTKRAHLLYNQISQKQNKYNCEAIIVNYYKQRDYMTGHLDDGEEDQISPIFSFCFGLSCVFLLGGPSRKQEPVGVKLEAGDLMIMADYSRTCYHGVPRIIQQSYKVPDIKQINQMSEKFNLKQENNEHKKQRKFKNQVSHVINYFRTHRLNFNVRQVYDHRKNYQLLDKLKQNLNQHKQIDKQF